MFVYSVALKMVKDTKKESKMNGAKIRTIVVKNRTMDERVPKQI
jgi:hypothetical protein